MNVSLSRPSPSICSHRKRNNIEPSRTDVPVQLLTPAGQRRHLAAQSCELTPLGGFNAADYHLWFKPRESSRALCPKLTWHAMVLWLAGLKQAVGKPQPALLLG